MLIQQRVNKFLTDAKEIEKDILPDSKFFLIKDRDVPYEDMMGDTTEAPVKDFKSGFLGASDADIWNTIKKYREYESKLDHASYMLEETVVLLDETSAKHDTAVMLYKTQEDKRQIRWRVPFRFVISVIVQLPFRQEKIYLDSIDEHGHLHMKKVYEKLGLDWPHGDK